MNQWEIKQAEISEAKNRLDDAYDAYRSERHQLEQEHDRLSDFAQTLQREIAERRSMVFSDINQFDGDTAELRAIANRVFDIYSEINVQIRLQEERKISEKIEGAQEMYQQQSRRQEEYIEQLYAELNQIAD